MDGIAPKLIRNVCASLRNLNFCGMREYILLPCHRHDKRFRTCIDAVRYCCKRVQKLELKLHGYRKTRWSLCNLYNVLDPESYVSQAVVCNWKGCGHVTVPQIPVYDTIISSISVHIGFLKNRHIPKYQFERAWIHLFFRAPVSTVCNFSSFRCSRATACFHRPRCAGK